MANPTIPNRLHPIDSMEVPLVDDYMRERNVPGYLYYALGKSVLLLDATRSSGPSTSNLTRYTRQHLMALEKGIYFRCYRNAWDACRTGVADGVLESWELTTIGYVNHAVNYASRGDGTVDTFDVGARGLDDVLGDCDVLVVRGQTLDGAAEELGHLFGGNWEEVE